MFVTKSQIFVFLACVAIGGGCGIPFSIAAAVKRFIKNRFLRAILDVFAFSVCAFIYVWLAFMLHFPSFRPYMTAGVFLGIALYMKSFHILLAKPTKKLYNKFITLYCKRKKAALRKTEEKKNDGNNQKRKHNRGRRCRAA